MFPAPAWPRTPEVRREFSFNQGWRFWLPPAPKPPTPYVPPGADCIKQGEFPNSTAAQDVTVGPHTSRYVCLESVSSQRGTPFASVAEFWLLDGDGRALPRTGWQVACVDSEEPGASDVAANAIDGDLDTKWHSQWQQAQPPHPHRLVIDLGKPTAFAGFRYLPRPDGNSVSMIKGWRFYATDQGPPRREATAMDVAVMSDVAWEAVNLPHTVRLEPLDASGGRNYQGVCWYRKHFALKPEWVGRKLYLVFEGAMQTADVWLNGKPLASHYCGYTEFTVDLSPAARFEGDNVLTVRLDNADNGHVPPGKPQGSLDFTYFGGLYRNVHLEVLNALHVTDRMLANTPAGGGVFVRFPKVDATVASVYIRADVANEWPSARRCEITQELRGPDSNVVAKASATARLEPGQTQVFTNLIEVTQPRLWHPEHPWLYVLHTVVSENGRAVDDTFTRLGIRSLRFDKDTGMYLNGERFVSSGANRHQDHPYVGYALPDSAQYRDVKKLRDAGFTSYRSHYPQATAFLDACDELGVLAIVSNPGWQYMGDELFKMRVYQDARDMIRRDRNHPAVILWEAQMNETDNRPVAPTLQRVVHEEYPGDQCYTAGDRTVLAGFDSWDLDYSRNNGTKPLWVREWGDQVDNWSDQQSSSRLPRSWGETPMLVQAWAHLGRFDGIWSNNNGPAGPGRGRLAGADLWAGIDCYRGYHHQPFYGGPLDLFRLPKFDFYMFQSQRPPDVFVPGVACGPMVFIANFATFQSPSTVTVFSNCEAVRLLQNGREIAVKKPEAGHQVPHPPFTFQVGKFSREQSMLFSTGVAAPGVEVGELKAEGLIGGKVAATHLVRSPGVPVCLELQPDWCGRALVADGADWVRVYARVTDSRGTTYPNGDSLVTFATDGPGQIVNDARIRANPIQAEAGIATALVRAGSTPGVITVRAEAFGLKPAEIRLTASPNTRPIWPPRP